MRFLINGELHTDLIDPDNYRADFENQTINVSAPARSWSD
jgi:hypothetical protein